MSSHPLPKNETSGFSPASVFCSKGAWHWLVLLATAQCKDQTQGLLGKHQAWPVGLYWGILIGGTEPLAPLVQRQVTLVNLASTMGVSWKPIGARLVWQPKPAGAAQKFLTRSQSVNANFRWAMWFIFNLFFFQVIYVVQKLVNQAQTGNWTAWWFCSTQNAKCWGGKANPRGMAVQTFDLPMSFRAFENDFQQPRMK